MKRKTDWDGRMGEGDGGKGRQERRTRGTGSEGRREEREHLKESLLADESAARNEHLQSMLGFAQQRGVFQHAVGSDRSHGWLAISCSLKDSESRKDTLLREEHTSTPPRATILLRGSGPWEARVWIS